MWSIRRLLPCCYCVSAVQQNNIEAALGGGSSSESLIGATQHHMEAIWSKTFEIGPFLCGVSSWLAFCRDIEAILVIVLMYDHWEKECYRFSFRCLALSFEWFKGHTCSSVRWSIYNWALLMPLKPTIPSDPPTSLPPIPWSIMGDGWGLAAPSVMSGCDVRVWCQLPHWGQDRCVWGSNTTLQETGPQRRQGWERSSALELFRDGYMFQNLDGLDETHPPFLKPQVV